MKTAVWIACVVGLGMLAVVRVDDLRDHSGSYIAGSVVAGIVIGVVLGWIAWAVVSLLRRRSPGFPIWVGVIGIGLALFQTLAVVTRRVGDEARAFEAVNSNCQRAPQVYGTAPEGFTYEQATAEERRDVLDAMAIDQVGNGPADVHYAFVPEEDYSVATLLSVPITVSPNSADDMAQGARDGPNETRVEQSRVGRYEVVWIDYVNGTSAAVAAKGCRSVWVLAEDRETTERLARAVFSA